MNFDRDFILKTSDGEPISPDLDKNDRHLFTGLTQEYVEMDRRVKIEKAERIAADKTEKAERTAEDRHLQAEHDSLAAKHAKDFKAIGDLITGINSILSEVDEKLKDLETRVAALEATP